MEISAKKIANIWAPSIATEGSLEKDIIKLVKQKVDEACQKQKMIFVRLNNGKRIKAIKCSECGCYFEEKEIQIKRDVDTCDDCLCPV